MLRSWFALRDECPTCHLRFERGEEADHWLGAFTINLVVALAATVGCAMYAMLRWWPSTTPALWAGGCSVVLTPILFFPFSRTLWVAWDISFRPHTDAERSGVNQMPRRGVDSDQ